MTGAVSVFPPRNLGHGSARYVGRAVVLPQFPDALPWVRFFVLSLSFLGLQLVWSCEMAQASPYLLSLGLSKSMMSIVFVAGPLSGLVVQPVVGALSDQCRSRLGRRRPFIIGGCVASSLAVLLLGWTREFVALFFADGNDGLTIALAIFSVYALDFSINVVQAMDRSLLVDVIPPEDQPSANAWASRMFGIGAVLGYFIGGIDLVAWTGGAFGDEQLKVLTVFTSFAICFFHMLTVIFVKERVLVSQQSDSGGAFGPALRDIWSTFSTLPRPIKRVFHVQFSSWIGWFPILFFSSTWVAEIYAITEGGATSLADATAAVRADATRVGTRAMLFQSIATLLTSILLPPLVAPFDATDDTPSHRWAIPLPWLSLHLLWTISNGFFALLLLSTWFVSSSAAGASTIIALCGLCWAVTNWVPFSILGELILRLTAAPESRIFDVDETSHVLGRSSSDSDASEASFEKRQAKQGSASWRLGSASNPPTINTVAHNSALDILDSPNSSAPGSPFTSVRHPYHTQEPEDSTPNPFIPRDELSYASRSDLYLAYSRNQSILQLHHEDEEELSEATPVAETARDLPPPRTSSDDGDESGDRAGVILGCHNVYLVMPQFIVTALSSLIFAIFAPHHSVIASPPPVTDTGNSTAVATAATVFLLARAEEASERGWDALGFIFRIGGVSALVSTYISWKMTREKREENAQLLPAF